MVQDEVQEAGSELRQLAAGRLIVADRSHGLTVRTAVVRVPAAESLGVDPLVDHRVGELMRSADSALYELAHDGLHLSQQVVHVQIEDLPHDLVLGHTHLVGEVLQVVDEDGVED